MSESYHIVHQGLTSEDVVAQVKNIDKFPCTVHIYDRVIFIANKDEAWSIATGIQVGWYLCEEYQEKNAQSV